MWLSNSCFLQAFPVENEAPLDVAKVLLLTSWLCEDIRLDMSILLTYSRSSLATKWWVCEVSCLLLMLKTAHQKKRGQHGPWRESLCRWCCVSSVSSTFSTFEKPSFTVLSTWKFPSYHGHGGKTPSSRAVAVPVFAVANPWAGRVVCRTWACYTWHAWHWKMASSLGVRTRCCASFFVRNSEKNL